MKIRKLHLKNIGVFDEAEILLRPCQTKDKAEIHIFTGRNGSGKTTLLMALASAFYGWKEDWEEPDEEVSLKDSPKNLPVNIERSLYKRFRYFQETEDDLVFKSRITVSTDEHLREHEVQEDDENQNLYLHEDVLVSGLPEELWGANEIRSYTLSEEISEYKAAVSSEGIPTVNFAVFAYSGYRFVKSEKIELLKEYNENPLSDSLDFVKTYEKFTINQWLANNLSQRALAREEGNQENANRFNENIKNLSTAISEVIGFEIDFKLKYSPPQLVLKTKEGELDFDVLPDGLRSLLSWLGDLLMRVDILRWQDDLPIFERNLILFLDEIEVHLHPAWQRKALPVVQKLFKNSQIFISTHSPFVINSVDDAWVYKLELDENGKAHVAEAVRSEDGHSYSHVLSEIFDIKEEFGIEVQKDLAKFKELRNKILASKNGSEKTEKELRKLARILADQSEELQTIVEYELRQINKRTGKSLSYDEN